MYSLTGLYILLFTLFYGFAALAYSIAIILFLEDVRSLETGIMSIILFALGALSIFTFVWCEILFIKIKNEVRSKISKSETKKPTLT